MQKDRNITTVYKPNTGVKVKVAPKPVYEDGHIIGYKNKITMNTEVYTDSQPLEFANTDELGEFMNNIDYDEQNQRLDLGV